MALAICRSCGKVWHPLDSEGDDEGRFRCWDCGRYFVDLYEPNFRIFRGVRTHDLDEEIAELVAQDEESDDGEAETERWEEDEGDDAGGEGAGEE